MEAKKELEFLTEKEEKMIELKRRRKVWNTSLQVIHMYGINRTEALFIGRWKRGCAESGHRVRRSVQRCTRGAGGREERTLEVNFRREIQRGRGRNHIGRVYQ